MRRERNEVSSENALMVKIRDDEGVMQEDFANLFPRAFCSQVREKALRTRLRLCEKAREAFSLGSISVALSCQVVHEKQLVIEPTFPFASLRHFYFSNSGAESSKRSLFLNKNAFKNVSARRSGPDCSRPD